MILNMGGDMAIFTPVTQAEINAYAAEHEAELRAAPCPCCGRPSEAIVVVVAPAPLRDTAEAMGQHAPFAIAPACLACFMRVAQVLEAQWQLIAEPRGGSN